MPFEPRLVHPDDEPERGLILAPDLIELAEQLSEEAACLAARYPANQWRRAQLRQAPLRQSPGGRAHRWLAGRWPRWQGAAAAVLVSLGVWGLTRGRSDVPLPAPGRIGVVRMVGGDREAPGIHNTGAVVPAALFQELTGPEREGLLDLMEEE